MAWILGILGIWTGITPFFNAAQNFYSWSHWIVGGIVAILGFALIARKPAEGWISGILGSWLFVAGFIGALLVGAGLWWNNILVGLGLIVIGFAAAQTLNRRPPRVQHTA